MSEFYSCSCSADGPLLLLACSGGSNVGQITNSAAIEMDRSGRGRFYCMTGIAAHQPGLVDTAKIASGVVALDGCPIACARKALEHIGIPVTQHVVVTDLGIDKSHSFTWTDEDIARTLNAVHLY
jgi:uncharacterized metal-binding protein